MQGSLPWPPILVDSLGPRRVFPFATRVGVDPLVARCHLVVISKPGIPLVANLPTWTAMPASWIRSRICRRLPIAGATTSTTYVRRNMAVLRYLKRQPWAAPGQVTVAGHSKGTSIVAHLAAGPGEPGRLPERQPAGPHAVDCCR